MYALCNFDYKAKQQKKKFQFFLPFKPQYPHTNSPNCPPYISIKNTLREFVRRSKHFLLGDYFINSNNLFS